MYFIRYITHRCQNRRVSLINFFSCTLVNQTLCYKPLYCCDLFYTLVFYCFSVFCRRVTLEKYTGRGKKILLVLIRQFSCLLCRLHLKDLEKNQVNMTHWTNDVYCTFVFHWFRQIDNTQLQNSEVSQDRLQGNVMFLSITIYGKFHSTISYEDIVK